MSFWKYRKRLQKKKTDDKIRQIDLGRPSLTGNELSMLDLRCILSSTVLSNQYSSDDSTSMYSSRSSFIGPESGPIPLAKITYDDPPTPKRGSLVRSTLNVPSDEGFGFMKSTYVHTADGIVRIQKQEFGEINHSFL